MKECKIKSQPGSFGDPTGALPRYTAFLFCQKRGCRLDIKVCIYRKCKKLKENDGIFSCLYKGKFDNI